MPRRRLLLTMVLATTAMLAPASAVHATTFTFDVTVGSSCVSGRGVASATHTVTLTTASGEHKARTSVMSSATGAWEDCLGRTVVATDRLTVSAAGSTRTFAVPRLTVAVARVSDVIQGRAPANARLTVEARDFSRVITATSTGSYEIDATAQTNIIGGQMATTTWVSGSGDVLRAYGYAPMIVLSRPGGDFSVIARRGQLITLTLTRPDGQRRATGHAVGNGGELGVDGSFYNAELDPLAAITGDTIRADVASDATFVVPATSVAGAASTNVLSGRCFPNATFQVYTEGPSSYSSAEGRTSSTGTFSKTATGDFRVGDDLTLICARASGDQVRASGTAK